MPKWKPGIRNQHIVKTVMDIAILFLIRDYTPPPSKPTRPDIDSVQIHQN